MSEARMRYALVEGEKHLPEKGIHGKCPLCGADVMAKCGKVRVHHWAHINHEDCDSWSEGKTDWHIAWQDQFPTDWQEYTIEKEGMKHRADVHIPFMENGAESILEFQHSFIGPEEVKAREAFYPNLAWVVDLTHKIREAKKMKNILKRPPRGIIAIRINAPNVFRIDGEGLPSAWIDCRWPVFFDFPDELADYSDKLLCLMPRIVGDASRWLVMYQKKDFLDACLKGTIMVSIRQTFEMFAAAVSEAVAQQQEIQKFQKYKEQLTSIRLLNNGRDRGRRPFNCL